MPPGLVCYEKDDVGIIRALFHSLCVDFYNRFLNTCIITGIFPTISPICHPDYGARQYRQLLYKIPGYRTKHII